MHLLSSLAWLAIGANAWSVDFSSGTDVKAGTKPEHKSGIHKGKLDGKCAPTAKDCYYSLGYYPNWGVYAKKYFVTDIPADHFTHLSYAFANVNNKTGEVYLSDPYADLQYAYPGDDTKAKGNNLYGNFKQLYKLKKENRYLNTLLAIGGFTYSANFGPVLASKPLRETFAKSAVKLVADLGLDGLDLDYEYVANSKEAEEIVDLLRLLREGLDKLNRDSKATAPFLLTFASPAGEQRYKVLNFPEMSKYVDLYNFMAVDYAGPSFSKKTGYLDNLYADKKNPDATPFNTASGIHYYLHEGKVPGSKIVVQNPLYGSAFNGTNGIGQSFKDAGLQGSLGTAGTWFVKDLPPKGFNLEVTNNKAVGGSYSYDKAQKYLIAHDTPVTVRQKVDYVKKTKLAGTSFWEISQDYKPVKGSVGPSLIANAIDEYGGVNALEKRENNLNYPFSVYDNIKKGLPGN
uniref:chitinase n=1 Tax=uncultured Neotyphodium TaxID=232232 RepID=Q7Z9Z5_9HYPO|nr:chitinase [uncultured Neotyphodium]